MRATQTDTTWTFYAWARILRAKMAKSYGVILDREIGQVAPSHDLHATVDLFSPVGIEVKRGVIGGLCETGRRAEKKNRIACGSRESVFIFVYCFLFLGFALIGSGE